MRTKTGTSNKAFLVSLSIAAGLAGCASPPAKDTAAVDNTVVPLAKDPSVPLLIIVGKKPDGTWCPEKVVSVAVEDCPADLTMTDDHTACRLQGQPIRWFAHSGASHENPGVGVNFEITFKTGDPLADKSKFPKTKCAKSENGALDCKIKVSTEPGTYDYTVTMSGGPGPACELDPRIYVNKYTLND